MITGLGPYAERPEPLDDINGATYWLAVYGDEHIAGLEPRTRARGIWRHVDGLGSLFAIDPGDAVVRYVEREALLEIDNAENNRGHREEHKDNCT